MTGNTPSALLADDIQAFQDELIPTIPEDTMDTLMSELQGLIATGIAEAAKNKGDKFPDFTLPDANNESRSLQDFLADGPLVISFYRGAWCPYCNLEINALQKHLPEITAAGGQLVAISPQVPDKSADQVSRSQLTFEVLSDAGNKLAKECGLVFTLPESLRPIYEAWQIDIPGHNADSSFELPIPATYIIDTNGDIRYAHVDMDYTKRLEPDIIIEQLKLL
ncbi:MAG: peroxiredoxin-like family protein [Gammaproteobacteria bacterium]|nr:MAG: peroxiredoxin-like family protein [Gammaproteobacteria bacterium]